MTDTGIQLNNHLQWIDRRLGQLGIDVRQSGRHAEMRCYLELLKEEIRMTEEFLKGDQPDGHGNLQ